jgi:hypothetical protein
MSGNPDTQPSPPFDALTFDIYNVPIDIRVEWAKNPDIVLDDPRAPTECDANSAYEYYRRKRATKVSSAVYALGKNPYPGLHSHRYVPELQINTPPYNPTDPRMGRDTPLLRYISQYLTSLVLEEDVHTNQDGLPTAPGELKQLGCIGLETNENPVIEISPRFRVDTKALATASTDRSAMTIIGNNDGIHPTFRRSNWEGTSDAEYEYLRPVLRIATGMLAMDGILDLWNALGQPLKHLPRNNLLRKQKKKHRVYYTGETSLSQILRTKEEMFAL